MRRSGPQSSIGCARHLHRDRSHSPFSVPGPWAMAAIGAASRMPQARVSQTPTAGSLVRSVLLLIGSPLQLSSDEPPHIMENLRLKAEVVPQFKN